MCSCASASAIDARVCRAMKPAEVSAIVSTGQHERLEPLLGAHLEGHEAGRRQQSQLHGEDVDEQDADPEGREREHDAREHRDEPVDGAAADGGDDSERRCR